MLQARRDFTAVIAESDMMAIGVLRALREHGLRVPEDVSVTGFDDIDLASFTWPALTTVRQDADALCASAVTTLLELIEGPARPQGWLPAPVLLPTELIVRGSTAPPQHRN